MFSSVPEHKPKPPTQTKTDRGHKHLSRSKPGHSGERSPRSEAANLGTAQFDWPFAGGSGVCTVSPFHNHISPPVTQPDPATSPPSLHVASARSGAYCVTGEGRALSGWTNASPSTPFAPRALRTAMQCGPVASVTDGQFAVMQCDLWCISHTAEMTESVFLPI